MNNKKTLMVLGAGVFQLEAIRKASAMGHHVITVDYLPGNIGHLISDEYVNASTIDSDSVLQAAREHRIDGIFTMSSDIALPAVAHVAEALGLPGPRSETVNLLTRKNRFRRLQKELGLDSPRSIEVTSFDESRAKWQGVEALVKPAVSSGSRGVARIRALDESARPVIEAACEFSYNDTACLEEFIDGRDACMEGFVLDGQVAVACTTDKHVRGFAVLGHEMPGDISPERQAEMIRQVQAVLTAAGHRNGPFDADFRLTTDRTVLLEITPRLGGNGVPALTQLSHGLPLITAAIQSALGETPCLEPDRPEREPQPGAAILFYSEFTGTVTSVAPEPEIRKRVPGVLELCMNLKPGQEVQRFKHGGHVFGYGVLVNKDERPFEELSGLILDALALEVIERNDS